MFPISNTSNKESYNALYDTFIALPVREHLLMNIPLEEIVAEVETLVVVSRQDRDKLVDAGMNPECIDTLQARVCAFDYIASYYNELLDRENKARNEWLEKSIQAYALKQRLLFALGVAFWNDLALLKHVKEIEESREIGDIHTDLLAIYLLGNRRPDLLQANNFDFAELDKAKASQEKLSDILARIIIIQGKLSEVRKIRDCAYTYLRQAMNEIKEYGQFICNDNPYRQKVYISDFWQRLFKNEKYNWDALRSCSAAA